MGSAQPALAEGSTPAGQTEPRSGYVISEQCPLRGVDAPSAGGSEDLEDLWKAEVDLFASKDNSHCPTYYSKDRDALAHDWPTLPPLCIPPDRPASTGRRACQGTGSQRCYWWPPCGGTNLGCQSWLSYWQQPGPCPWDGISSLRRTKQYGTLDTSCGISTFGHSNRSLPASQSECLTPFLRLEPRLRDASTPLSGLFSPLGASTVVKTPLPLN